MFLSYEILVRDTEALLVQRLCGAQTLHKEFAVLRPASPLGDPSTIRPFLDHDSLVAEYRVFVSLLEWSAVAPWDYWQHGRGRPARPETASPNA